jgi:hypothetical protein
MNSKPKFAIGDRVKLLSAYDPETDEFYPTDAGDSGVIYGLAFNSGDRWGWESAWVYWIRFDEHHQPWLGYPFWDPDPTPEEEITALSR